MGLCSKQVEQIVFLHKVIPTCFCENSDSQPRMLFQRELNRGWLIAFADEKKKRLLFLFLEALGSLSLLPFGLLEEC